MIGRRSELPRLQSDFYRDSYRKILRCLYMCILIIYLLVLIIIYQTISKPRQEYYANTTDGMIIKMPEQV